MTLRLQSQPPRILTICLDGLQWRQPASGGQHCANIGVSPQGYQAPGKLVRDNDSVASSFLISCKSSRVCIEGRKDRDLISVRTLSDRQNLQPVGETVQLRKDYLKLNSMWKPEIGNRKVQKWLCSRLIENSIHKDWNLHQANPWTDQAQRKKISSCGEMEMRNRLRQKGRTRTCQKLRNYEEVVLKKQIESDN